jgi:hypothetical protein
LQALALMFQIVWSALFNMSFVFFGFYSLPDRLPHFQVDFPASNSGRADGDCRFGLADLSLSPALAHDLSPISLAAGIA